MFNNFNDGNYKRVTKRTAKKLFNAGTTIYLLPCKACLNSYWFSPYAMEYNHVIENGENFDTMINSFEFYNCNNEMGKYTSFYVHA